MKQLLNGIMLLLTLVLTGISCKKDENKVYVEGGIAPVLSSSATDDIMMLSINNKDNPAATLSWTNPEYRFNTGVSSQNVTYYLQVDTAGTSFAGTSVQETSIANDLSVTLTEKDINTFMTKMALTAGLAYKIQMRIKSTLSNKSIPLYSNAINMTVIPYLDFVIEPPGTLANNYADGNLWLTGDATTSGFSNPLPSPYDVTQKFTKIDVLHYVDTITFKGGGGYKLIQKQGDWSTQYHALDGTAKLSGSFEKKDSDPQFPSPGAGDYKVEINFQTGIYKLTKL